MKRRICPQVFDQKLSNFRNYLLLGSNGFLYICVCVSDCLLNFKRNHLQLFSSCTFDYTREVPEKMEFHSVWKSTLDSLGAKIQIRVNVQIQNSFGIGNGLFFCQQNATKDTNYLKMVFFLTLNDAATLRDPYRKSFGNFLPLFFWTNFHLSHYPRSYFCR